MFVFFFLVATHGQIQDLVVFYQSYSHHLERCYPLSSFSSTAFCVFECIFHLVVSLDPEFGVHDQKVSIQEFARITQKGQNRVPVKRGVGVKAQLGLKASVRVRVRVDEGNQHFFPITARPGRGNAYFHVLLMT